MDPRIAWYPKEQLGPAHQLWTRLWETQLLMENMYLNNANPNLEQRPQEFIPLDITNNFDQKRAPSNKFNDLKNQENINRTKRTSKYENKASTYGLNHSSNIHLLREESWTPWVTKDKRYSRGVLGQVFH